MLGELKELWKFRELLVTMVQRELKIRYKNSALGFLWSLINPVVTVLVLSFVLKNFMYDNPPANISAYVLAAYLPFIFFQLSLMDSAQTILTAMPIIKKIYFPREILPIASVISNFIHLVLAMGVFFLYLLAVYIVFPGDWPLQINTLFLPILLFISFCLSLGFSFYISALNTFYEDIKYVVGIVLWLMFFITPVMYFEERVANSDVNLHSRGWVYMIYNFNPLAALANAYRKTILAPPHVKINGVETKFLPLNWTYVWIAAGVSMTILVTGYATFNRLKWRFVERP